LEKREEFKRKAIVYSMAREKKDEGIEQRVSRMELRRMSGAVTEAGTPPRPEQSQMGVSRDDSKEGFFTPPDSNSEAGSGSSTTSNSSRKSDSGSLPDALENLDPDDDHSSGEDEEGDGDAKCPICLEKMTPSEEMTRLNPCGHYTCTQCIEAWIEHRHGFKKNGNCPVCKSIFYSSDTFFWIFGPLG
jgi:hypothetical protein